jgi:hypothetical protein
LVVEVVEAVVVVVEVVEEVEVEVQVVLAKQREAKKTIFQIGFL